VALDARRDDRVRLLRRHQRRRRGDLEAEAVRDYIGTRRGCTPQLNIAVWINYETPLPKR
jgi:hypothetical protein